MVWSWIDRARESTPSRGRRAVVAAAITAALTVAGCGSGGASPAQRHLDAAMKTYNRTVLPLKAKLITDAKANDVSALTSDFATISKADTALYESVKAIRFPAAASAKLSAFQGAEGAAIRDLMGVETATGETGMVRYMDRFAVDHKRAVAAAHALYAVA